MTILDIKDLHVGFPTGNGIVQAVNGVSLSVRKGETFGIIGESGSGKSVVGHAILRHLQDNAIIKGSIHFEGRDVSALTDKELREIRGEQISLLPQNPTLALNPVLKNKIQITEVFEQRGISRKEGLKKAVDTMSRLYLKDPEQLCERYPHQLSGGMKQRLLAAISLSFQPKLLIADEPTKGLDPESRWMTIELFKDIKKEYNSTMMIITHDIDLALEICDRVAVMYAGEIVEINKASLIINSPAHPYTRGLINALPRNGMVPLNGMSPSRINLPDACLFHPRCEHCSAGCKEERPELKEYNGGSVRCHQY